MALRSGHNGKLERIKDWDAARSGTYSTKAAEVQVFLKRGYGIFAKGCMFLPD